jgi:hypothetical protein
MELEKESFGQIGELQLVSKAVWIVRGGSVHLIPFTMGLSNAAIIVIVLVACLAATALGASLFKIQRDSRSLPP